jgi:glyoxylase-like metal-dependent hydrolase (beta-lactamase superfamily II)
LRVSAPAETVDIMRRGFFIHNYRAFVWGRPKARFTAQVAPSVVELTGEPGGDALHLIPAPGHCPDHHVIHVPSRGWLFGGDVFVSRAVKMINSQQDPHVEIASLRRVLELDFDTLLCGHRGIITRGKDAVRERLEQYESLRDEVWRREERGETIAQITAAVLGREETQAVISLGHFSKRRLVGKLSRHSAHEWPLEDPVFPDGK